MSANRAWSKFQIKSVNEESRTFSGWASTPALDLQGDKIDPLGVRYTLPLPILWNHDSGRPVGHVTAASVTREGIYITAQIAKVDTPPSLKEELDRAWSMIKTRLAKGLSVGFRTLAETPIATGFRIDEWRLLEVSIVAIAANQDCSITAIKNADRAASTRGSALSASTAARSDPRVAQLRAARLSHDRRVARPGLAYQLFGLD